MQISNNYKDTNKKEKEVQHNALCCYAHQKAIVNLLHIRNTTFLRLKPKLQIQQWIFGACECLVQPRATEVRILYWISHLIVLFPLSEKRLPGSPNLLPLFSHLYYKRHTVDNNNSKPTKKTTTWSNHINQLTKSWKHPLTL